MLVGQGMRHIAPLQRLRIEQSFDLRRQSRQYRLEINREYAERFQQAAADFLQLRIIGRIFGEFPGFVGIDIGIHMIGLFHRHAQCLAVFTSLIQCSDLSAGSAQA